MSQKQPKAPSNIGKELATQISSQGKIWTRLCDYDPVSSDSDSEKENLVIVNASKYPCNCNLCAPKALNQEELTQNVKTEENKPLEEKFQGINPPDRKRSAPPTPPNTKVEGFRSAKELCAYWPGK